SGFVCDLQHSDGKDSNPGGRLLQGGADPAAIQRDAGALRRRSSRERAALAAALREIRERIGSEPHLERARFRLKRLFASPFLRAAPSKFVGPRFHSTVPAMSGISMSSFRDRASSAGLRPDHRLDVANGAKNLPARARSKAFRYARQSRAPVAALVNR